MSENAKITAEAEELSRLLDELNSGRQPASAAQETAELLAVAAIIKETGAYPPQHILDGTVEQARAGLPAGRSKRFSAWLYSGALGTAAAVLLVISLNLLPSGSPQMPSAPPPVTAPEMTGVAPEIPGRQQAPLVSQAPATKQPPAADSAQRKNAVLAEQAPAETTSGKAETSMQSPTAEQAKPPALAKRSAVNPEQIPMTVDSLSSSHKATSELSGKLPNRRSAAVFSLPGQNADEIVTDKDGGTVRQVFHSGTPQEIIITQRLQAKESALAKPATPAEDTPAKPGVNKITATVHGQEVTVEGRQPSEELLKIAETLEQ
jgi:hypothetical protein